MTSLIAKTPADGLLPITVGTTSLAELAAAGITSVTRAAGAKPEAFKSATGAAFPAPNRTTGRDGARAVWTGPDQCFWIGPPLASLPGHALTDQSDGWAALRLSGADAAAVLARLVPIDLRDSQFKRGHTARSLMVHVPVSLTRSGVASFDILCFRSMVATAIHELETAMKSVAAIKAPDRA